MAKKSLSVQERIADIVKRSNLSEQIVRQVFKAGADSVAESLRKGESAMLPGICSMRPIFKRKVTKFGDTKSVLDARCDPLSSLSTRLEDIESLNDNVDTLESDFEVGIRIVQLEALV